MRSTKFIVTFHHFDYDSYSRFMDALFASGSPDRDWTVTSIDHEGLSRRYEVHSKNAENIRAICKQQSLGIVEEAQS